MFNNKYKLIGFSETPSMTASIMIKGTGKVVDIPPAELLKSDVADDLNRNELVEGVESVFKIEF